MSELVDDDDLLDSWLSYEDLPDNVGYLRGENLFWLERV